MLKDHEGLPVSGYRPQSVEAVETVNTSKALEEHVLRLVDEVSDDTELQADKRWLAIARTDIERGFMALNRAVFKPERAVLVPDPDALIERGFVIERGDSPEETPLFFSGGDGHGDQWSDAEEDALLLVTETGARRLANALGIQCRVAPMAREAD